MTNLVMQNGRLILASAVFVAGLALTGGAFAQASSGGSGNTLNPATSGAGSSNSGTPCEKGCGPTAIQSDAKTGGSMEVQTNRPNSDDLCTPGSTVNANSSASRCTDSNGKKLALPNEKGNSAT